LTDQTRQGVNDYLRAAGKKPDEFLFTSRCGVGPCMTTRQYARLVFGWIASIGPDSKLFGTHSLRRTKATLIYRRIRNLRGRAALARPHEDRKHSQISWHRGG
jgi:integrase